ncbi:MAG: murein biosynthesis integral membrane protein MurJ [Desulfobacteraceae bacterium]|nr:MAG: murein biosynthesis integral membrane protein MurJ [Desulfobacteraceae bacterium]
MTKTLNENQDPGLKKALWLATLIVAGANVLSRILGFLRVQLIAYLGGTGPAVDAYSFSFTLPDLLNHFLAGSALSITFIPIFQKLLLQKGEEKAWRFFSNLMTGGTVLFLVFIGFAMFYTAEIIALAGGNINDPAHPEQFLLTVRLTRIILPAQLFFFWGALLNGVQYAHKQFLIPNLAPLVYNFGIICGGWLLYPYIGIDGFCWGVLAGAFIGNVVVQIPGALRVGFRYKPLLDLGDKDLRKYVWITLPFIVGLGMNFSNEFLFRIFGSYIPNGAGALAGLDYAYKIMSILVALFGVSFAAGFYPFISQMLIEKKFAEVQRLFNNILIKVAALLLPLSVCMMVLSPDIIAVLLQRGRFTADSTLLTAGAFTYYLLGAFCSAVILIVNRLFYALENTLLPMLVSTFTVLACLPLYGFLGHAMGAKGIALAASVSMIIQCAVMLLFWNKRHPNPELKSVTYKFALVLVTALLGFFLCWGLKAFILKNDIQIQSVFWYHLFICCTAGIPPLIVMTAILELTGVQGFYGVIRDRMKKILKKRNPSDA